MDSDSEVVWAKLYFSRDIPEETWIPKKLQTPTVAKPAPKPASKHGKQPAAKPTAICPSLSMMGNMCSCSRLCGTARGSFTLSLFRRRGRQKTDEWLQCMENFAYVHYVHGTISIYACQRESQILGQFTASN